MVIAERAVSVGEITYTPQTAIDNPLFQALQARLDSMKAQNTAITQQVNISMTASRDTAAAIDSLQQLEIVQAAQAQAYRDFQLKQQAYELTKQQLEMQAAGLSPVPAPVVRAAVPAPGPIDHTKSPF
jgi:tryptophan 2,3-dioxygenase